MSGHTKWADVKRDRPDRPVHEFTAERDGATWAVIARDLPRVFTQVRQLGQAEEAARSVTALMLDVAPDSFDVVVETVGEPVALAEELRKASSRREQADEQLRITRIRVIRGLAESGLSVRDIGVLTELSHQRVAQVLAEA